MKLTERSNKVVKYVIKRVLLAVLTVFIICAITFFTMNAVPGGPFNREKALDEATIQALNERYGLNDPLPVQFGNWLKGLFTGDLGVSLKNGRQITDIISESFPISAKLGVTAMGFALVLGTIFGSVAALMRNKLPDRLIVFLSTLFTAVPSFVLATLLLYVFCIQLKLLPVWDPNNPSYILPVISLAAYPTAYVTRLSKTSMLDALGQDYIRTARAKGVSENKIVTKHALKNSLIPVITYFGPMLAYIVTGSLVVEQIFSVSGIGRAFVNSITGRDYTLVMGTTIVLSIFIAVMNLVSDVMYKIVDPRIVLE